MRRDLQKSVLFFLQGRRITAHDTVEVLVEALGGNVLDVTDDIAAVVLRVDQ